MISASTSPGLAQKPSEDWFGIADHHQPAPIVVLDGGTARTETGCRHGVAWYAEHLGNAIVQRLTSGSSHIPLVKALASGIAQVADLHRGTCDLDHPGTPSAAVGIVVPLGANRWEYAVLGDVTVVFDKPNGPVVISDHRISQSAAPERAEASRWPIGSEQKNEAMVAMKHVELAERNRSYWIAAADPTAASHALTGAVDVVSQLAVLTDGAARAVSFGLTTWAGLFELLAAHDPDKLIERVRSAEASDPDGVRWPRNKRSDDATVVYFTE